MSPWQCRPIYPFLTWPNLLQLSIPASILARHGRAHSDAGTFKQQISQSVSLLQRYGQRFFDNDSSLWDSISGRREATADVHRQSEQSEQFRRKAETAFEKGDWSTVIAMYGSLTVTLSAVEAKRLAIAQKQRGVPPTIPAH